MRRMALAAVAAAFISFSLVSCGGDHHSTPPVVTQILSDSVYDGNIALDAGVFTLTQGMTGSIQSVFAGIDPVTEIEYRAFLDFPLGGGNGVPIDAFIQAATLDIVIDNVFLQTPSDTIPIRIDLVSFQPPNLIETDFNTGDQPTILATIIVPPIAQSDSGNHVPVDVTQLMKEVQRLGLPDFQVRILQDPDVSAPPGLIEINDTTGANRDLYAPLLQVSYF